MGIVKGIMRRVVGEHLTGRLDFFRYPDPSMQQGWGGPFNGQKFRQRIFFDLLYYFPIKAIVETGTYCGTTTALFGATSLPVYTAEVNPRYFSHAKMRFQLNRSNIHLYESDSRYFLKHLSANNSVPKEDVFFYLDAHWGTDLPLREELDIIFSTWRNPIVMIDDFSVPDSGYGFDDYGPGKALNLSYIDSVVSAHKLSAFFPAANASAETGARRGSVVLCQEMSGLEVETRIKTLIRGASYDQHIGGE